MNPLQFLKFALHGLWRQKVRTALTLVGVSVGTCALAFSLSLGLGLRAFIDTEFKGRDDFWRVLVRVDEPPPDEGAVSPERKTVVGEMSDERRARIREALIEKAVKKDSATRVPKLITPSDLAAIRVLPDVAEVRTFHSGMGELHLPGGARPVDVGLTSGPLTDLAPRLIAGGLPSSPDAPEVVVSEFALYELGVRDDAALDAVVGKSVRLDAGAVKGTPPQALAMALLGGRLDDALDTSQTDALAKIVRALPGKLDAFDLSAREKAALLNLKPPSKKSEVARGEYRVCGVVRLVTREERKKLTPLDTWELTHNDVFLPPATGDALFGQLPSNRSGGFVSADVRVKPGTDLPGTVKAIEDMGFRTHSGAKWFAAAKREVTLIAAGLNLFALIALFVAGVGITNTLVTSVIERTHEIGILRAVGATRGQIVSLFLLEGAIIGLLGAACGLALAWGLALWADEWVRGLIAGQMDGQKMLSTTIFVFPAWLWAGSVLFAVGVTTLAAVYPARRASRIHPIEALRYG